MLYTLKEVSEKLDICPAICNAILHPVAVCNNTDLFDLDTFLLVRSGQITDAVESLMQNDEILFFNFSDKIKKDLLNENLKEESEEYHEKHFQMLSDMLISYYEIDVEKVKKSL